MVKTEKAIITSALSALIIGILYFLLQKIMTSISSITVGIIVFIVALIGMKYKDWTK